MLCNAIAELLNSPETVKFFSALTMAGNNKLTLPIFLKGLTRPSLKGYNLKYNPITAIQTKPLVGKQRFSGLLACGPKTLKPGMFDQLPSLSPHTFFGKTSPIQVSAAGYFTALHINLGFTLGVSTLISGQKLFVMYSMNKHNQKIMQQWHLLEVGWQLSLALMRKLTDPMFQYVEPGQSVYIGIGQIHFVLTTQAGALHTYDLANPLKLDWPATLACYKSMLKGFVDHLSHHSLSQLEEAIKNLISSLKLWQEVQAPEQELPGIDSVT